jgi:hypothetical protein
MSDDFSSKNPSNDDAYKLLCLRLIMDGAEDWHNFHCPKLRGQVVSGILTRRKYEGRKKTSKPAVLRELFVLAELSRGWFGGNFDSILPFSVAAAWLGWNQKELGSVIMNPRTGEHMAQATKKLKDSEFVSAHEATLRKLIGSRKRALNAALRKSLDAHP